MSDLTTKAREEVSSVSEKLNGKAASGGSKPFDHPETACSDGKVVVCDGSDEVKKVCDEASPAPATTTDTGPVVEAVIGLIQ